MSQSKLTLLIGLLAYAVAMRLMPYALRNCDVHLDPTIMFYPWNFSPLTAVCLMSGACLADRRLALILPLSAMLISNVGIGLLSGHWDWAFPEGTWWLPYASYAAAVWLGSLLRRTGSRRSLRMAVAMGLGFEVFFFAVSNVPYLYGSASIYPQTLTGLMECYAAALPFLRNASISTLAFTLLVFGPLGAFAPHECKQTLGKLVPEPTK